MAKDVSLISKFSMVIYGELINAAMGSAYMDLELMLNKGNLVLRQTSPTFVA